MEEQKVVLVLGDRAALTPVGGTASSALARWQVRSAWSSFCSYKYPSALINILLVRGCAQDWRQGAQHHSSKPSAPPDLTEHGCSSVGVRAARRKV